ncbi:MAG TPA: hypothetical protein PKI19_10480, partial [Elusimicrobiales bacterium]|nr:hypothetical protein [Elusimicrobiales bacterium]
TTPLLLLLVFSTPLLFAQDLEKEGQKPAAAAAVQAEAGKAAAEAEKAAVAESKEVTYEQVLEKPDDLDLNYAYAKTQVRKGDLKGAAGTLERMLMIKADLYNIRLFYAVVLYRLDSLVEAQLELENLIKSPAPAALKTEAAGYVKAIKKMQKLTQASGGLSAGVEYDSNRNASPTSRRRLFMGNPLQLTGSSLRRDDTSLLLTGNAELRRAVGSQRKHEVFGSFTYYRADQKRVEAVNLQALSYKLGGVYNYGLYRLTPALTYDSVQLAGEDFLSNNGVDVRLERKINKVTEAWAGLKYAYQDHLASPDIPSNPERRGGLYGISAGAGRVLNPVMKLSADLGFSAKRAKKNYNSYNTLSFGLQHSWLLGKGRFLLSSASAGRDTYRQADTAISRKKRIDNTLRAGLVGGVPLASLHRKLAKLKDFTLTLNLEHFRSSSNLLNYTYTNNKAALLLNYRWALGL